jgi:hypothetical protein
VATIIVNVTGAMSEAAVEQQRVEYTGIGIALLDMTMDQFMDIEDSWSTREERV